MALGAAGVADAFPVAPLDFTHAQADHIAHFTSPRDAEVVNMKAGQFTVSFDTGGFKQSFWRDGTWHTWTWIGSYTVHSRVVRGCLAYYSRHSVAYSVPDHYETTPTSENAKTFAGPRISWTEHSASLCLSSVYEVWVTGPHLSTDFVEKYLPPKRTAGPVEFTLHRGEKVKLPLG